MSFDWRTEETVHWDEPPQAEPPPDSSPKRRRWRWFLLAILLLLVGGALGAFWLVQQRVETATTQVTDDVLASYELISSAAKDGDAELVATFLSGRDKEWSAVVERTVLDGEYQSRESFGLTWLPSDPATAVISTTLNPQFNSAELVTEQQYAYPIGNGLTETVRLRQTAVYRLGPDRWLLAPPEDDFWGETKTKEGFYLTLQYPARDEVLAQRLALDIDTALAALCANVTFSCPENFHLQIEFSTDPGTLMASFDPVVFVEEGMLLRLPTSTLAGVPQNDSAYHVMARGYITQVLLPVMRQMRSISSGQQWPIKEAWLDWQLDRLALQGYPLHLSDRHALAEEGISLSTGEQLWVSNEPANTFAYALIEFLIQDLYIAPGTIMDSLANTVATSYEEWLLVVTEGRYTSEELETHWQEYLQEKPSS